MRHYRLIGLGTVAVLAAAVALVLTLTLRGGSESAPSDEELAAIAEEINKEVPNVGLGEGSPPPDAGDWATDFSKASVPLEEFQSGGPPKDGIPAIDEPRYMQVEDVDFLDDPEPVSSSAETEHRRSRAHIRSRSSCGTRS